MINTYVPNSGEGLRRLDYRVGEWDVALARHVKQLEARGKVGALRWWWRWAMPRFAALRCAVLRR